MNPQVTLELRTARDNEAGPEAAAAVFAALPNPPSFFQRLFTESPTFTFEWLNQGQTTYSLLTVPQEYQEYISGQLVSNYPEVLIQPLEHNPLDEFQKDLPKSVGELRFNSATYHSLRTFQEFKDIDPLSSTLSALSKLLMNEVALIQFTVCKAAENWKDAGFQAVSPSHSGSDSAPTQTISPHADSIKRKLADTGYEVAINILVQAGDKFRARQLLESIALSFNAFQSQSAELKLTTPFFAKNHREKILNRAVKPKNFYLSGAELASLYHLPNKKLSSVRGLAWGKTLRGEPPHNLPIFATIPEEKRDDLNLFARAEFKNLDQIFGIQKEDRRRHMYVVGKSGTGKSTLLANMIINDLKHDEGLAVIDPHGDLVETVLNYIPKRRINDVIIIDPSDQNAVVKLNLFEGGSTVHRELVASGIVSIFQKLYGHTWGPRLEYVLRNALLTLLQRHAKLSDVIRILTDKKYRDRVVDELDDPVLQNFWRAEFDRLNDKQRVEAISPILNKVGQFVTSPLIRRMVDTDHSSFDIEEAMNSGKIVLMNLSQGKIGEDNAALLGAMMITKIQLAAMNRVYMDEKDRKDFFLYIDEFQNFATTSFVKILSEARKYRLSLILANQYVAQIPEEVQAAIFGNAGNLVSFIVGASDGSILQREFAEKYSIEDLVSLGRYQIITRLLIDGQMSLPFPAHTLGLASSFNQNREKVLKVSRERYAR